MQAIGIGFLIYAAATGNVTWTIVAATFLIIQFLDLSFKARWPTQEEKDEREMDAFIKQQKIKRKQQRKEPE